MRCSICNKRLTTDEILVSRDGTYEPCNECIQVAADLVSVITPEEEVAEVLITVPPVEPRFPLEGDDDDRVQ